MKQSGHDVPEEKTSHLRKELFFCDNNWLFDLEFLVNVDDLLNHLNIELQGKNKLFSNLINLINAFKMKLKLFISQLENEDVSQFPYIK